MSKPNGFGSEAPAVGWLFARIEEALGAERAGELLAEFQRRARRGRLDDFLLLQQLTDQTEAKRRPTLHQTRSLLLVIREQEAALLALYKVDSDLALNRELYAQLVEDWNQVVGVLRELGIEARATEINEWRGVRLSPQHGDRELPTVYPTAGAALEAMLRMSDLIFLG